MSKRLQVVLDEEEFEEVRAAARRNRMTVAEWVRQGLRKARENEPRRAAAAKLEALEEAVRHSFPTGEIDEMVAEIERGYGSS